MKNKILILFLIFIKIDSGILNIINKYKNNLNDEQKQKFLNEYNNNKYNFHAFGFYNIEIVKNKKK